MKRDTHMVPQAPKVQDNVGRCRGARSNVVYLHIRARCPEDCKNCRLCDLWLCDQCGGVEGTLTSGGCPGFRLSLDQLETVFEHGLSALEAQEMFTRG